MSRIRNKNTKPEMMFRQYIWAQGIRGYRLHNKIIGKPDLYFPTKQIAVFIDGCFWHKCPTCYKEPASNRKFWQKKIQTNIDRDIQNDKALKALGIEIIHFWECDIKKDIVSCYNQLKALLR